jgi:hypothetical protein
MDHNKDFPWVLTKGSDTSVRLPTDNEKCEEKKLIYRFLVIVTVPLALESPKQIMQT